MGVFKRRLKPHQWLTPDQMLEVLGDLHLVAVAGPGSIHLAAHPAIAWLLAQACTGTPGPVPQQLLPHLVLNQASPGLQAYVQQLQGQLFNTTRRRKGAPGGGVRASIAPSAAAGAAAPATDQQQQQQQGRSGKRPRSPAAMHTPPAPAAATPGAAAPHPPSAAGEGGSALQQAARAAPGAAPAPGPAALQQLSQPSDGGSGSAAGSRSPTRVEREAAPSVNPPELMKPSTVAAPPLAPAAAGAAAGARGTAAEAAADGGTSSAAGVAPEVVYVRLTLEEAFFLQYTLGSCQVAALAPGPTPAAAAAGAQQGSSSSSSSSSSSVAAPDGGNTESAVLQPLDDQALWDWCVAASGQPNTFPATYAAYHHFRSKGWLLRSGGLYGAHYVLYRAHPAIVHSEFVAMVVQQQEQQQPSAAGAAPPHPVHAGMGTTAAGPSTATTTGAPAAAPSDAGGSAAAAAAGGGEGGYDDLVPCGGVPGLQPMAWLEASILQRLAQQVFKKLLLVLVAPPAGGVCRGPQDLLAMSVSEVHVRRWTPRPGQV